MAPQPLESDPQTIEEWLLEESNRRAARCVRDGEVINESELPSKILFQVEASPEVIRHIFELLYEWFKTGEPERLAELLKTYPRLIAHHGVFRQLLHWKKLQRYDEEGDWEAVQVQLKTEKDAEQRFCLEQWYPEEPILPAGTRKAAQQALHQVLSTWVSVFLPGYKVERPPATGKSRRRRGAPRKISLTEAELLLDEFNELYEKLPDKDLKFKWVNKKRESQSALINRVVALLTQLHRDSWRYHVCGDPEELAKIPEPKETLSFTEAYKQNIPIPEYPLSQKVATRLVKYALQKMTVPKARLLYALLAYYEGTAPDTIRGIILRAEEDHPHLHQRKHH